MRLGQSANARGRLEPRAQGFIAHVAYLLRHVDHYRSTGLSAVIDAREDHERASPFFNGRRAPKSPLFIGKDTLAPGGAKLWLATAQSPHRVSLTFTSYRGSCAVESQGGRKPATATSVFCG